MSTIVKIVLKTGVFTHFLALKLIIVNKNGGNGDKFRIYWINAEGIRKNDNKLRIYCYSCVINGDKCGGNGYSCAINGDKCGGNTH